MAVGSSKTLATAGRGGGDEVCGVAISPDGRLVAAGSFNGVHDLQSPVGMHSEFSSRRRYISGAFTLVNYWRRCRDTETSCGVWCSPPTGVDW